MVKNPSAMREMWVWSLGWKDPLGKEMVTHSSILAWRIPWTEVHGVTKSQTRLSDFQLLLSNLGESAAPTGRKIAFTFFSCSEWDVQESEHNFYFILLAIGGAELHFYCWKVKSHLFYCYELILKIHTHTHTHTHEKEENVGMEHKIE